MERDYAPASRHSAAFSSAAVRVHHGSDRPLHLIFPDTARHPISISCTCPPHRTTASGSQTTAAAILLAIEVSVPVRLVILDPMVPWSLQYLHPLLIAISQVYGRRIILHHTKPLRSTTQSTSIYPYILPRILLSRHVSEEVVERYRTELLLKALNVRVENRGGE